MVLPTDGCRVNTVTLRNNSAAPQFLDRLGRFEATGDSFGRDVRVIDFTTRPCRIKTILRDIIEAADTAGIITIDANT
jgi:hypothetical protein